MRYWWLCYLSLFLTSCGGGGDSNTITPSPIDSTTSIFSIAGEVTVAEGVITDSDVNDVNASFKSNDTPDTAQSLPNPVIVGGYVNLPLAGGQGRSFSNGDYDDFYVVDLFAGQQITLLIGTDNLRLNDLDLGLLNLDGTLVDASVSSGNVESVAVPKSGRFLVQVQAYSGASNYVLTIGQATTQTTSSQSLRLSQSFVPEQLIAQFNTQPHSLSSLGIKKIAGNSDRRQLFQLDQQATKTVNAQSISSTKQRFTPKFASLKDQLKYQTLLAVKSLRQRTDVVSADLNFYRKSLAIPNDQYYKLQWDLPLMNLPQTWDITTGSSDVIVAVIDTGVLIQHPDLQGKFVDGYDFIKDTTTSLDGDGIDNNPDDPGDDAANGSSFHGTHVSGTIGALTNNGEGIAGISWQTKIMPLRVLGKNGEGSDYDIEQAIRYAAGLANDSGKIPTKHADIINMSLGGYDPMNWDALITQARKNGVFIVAAAGNDGDTTLNYPAATAGVIGVAAVDMNKQRASYSNYNSSVDITAPGGSSEDDVNGDGIPDGILSTAGDDTKSSAIQMTYRTYVGTSMATPHVAGVIALMKAVNPQLTPDQFDSLLASGALTEDLGTAGRDNSFGYGLIDAYKAVTAALNIVGKTVPVAPPVVSAVPQALNFGSVSSVLSLKINNAGGGELKINKITSDNNALQINPLQVDANGAGTYNVTLQRGATNGTFQANITIASNGGTSTIPVIWNVGALRTGNAGRQYILLVDTQTGDTVNMLTGESSDGHYPYEFTGVSTGTYQIVSGSDADNNDSICDAGESCGAYLTTSQPVNITVTQNMSNINFVVNYDTQFLSTKALGLSPRRSFKKISQK
jgi:serine protease